MKTTITLIAALLISFASTARPVEIEPIPAEDLMEYAPFFIPTVNAIGRDYNRKLRPVLENRRNHAAAARLLAGLKFLEKLERIVGVDLQRQVYIDYLNRKVNQQPLGELFRYIEANRSIQP